MASGYGITNTAAHFMNSRVWGLRVWDLGGQRLRLGLRVLGL